MVLAFLAAVPLRGYLVTATLAIILSAIGLLVFDFFEVTAIRLIALGTGLYILLKFALPGITTVKDKDKEKTYIFLAIVGIILIIIGLPNVFLGATTGQTYVLSLN